MLELTMRVRPLFFLAALLVLASACCKEKEEETTYLSFTGSPEFTIESFVRTGETLTITPKELVSRDASDTKTDLPGCYWYISQLDRRDTVRREGDPASVPASFTFTIPDSLQTLTILCGMFAEGYSNATASASCVVVRTRGGYSSLQGVDYPVTLIRDGRDGRLYHYTTAAGLDWMAENLPHIDDPQLREGFAEFVAWAYAKSEKLDRIPWRMEYNTDEVYGDGFRKVRDMMGDARTASKWKEILLKAYQGN